MSDGSGKRGRVNCPVCKRRFTQKVPGQLFCCKTCADRYMDKPAKLCRNCGAVINEGGRRIYCSDACKRQAGYRRRKKERMGTEPKESRQFSHTCQWCKVPFVCRYEEQKYCCGTCWRKAKEQERQQSDQKTAVRIRVLRPLGDVYQEMQPEVGRVYAARSFKTKQGAGYIIPEIGKYGLLVRRNECEEV